MTCRDVGWAANAHCTRSSFIRDQPNKTKHADVSLRPVSQVVLISVVILGYIMAIQALPKNDYADKVERLEWSTAYETCLRFEREAGNDKTALIHARLLGYLIREAVNDEARHVISREINSCQSKKAFTEQAKWYVYFFLRCCEWFYACRGVMR